jgi:hypothetical protein
MGFLDSLKIDTWYRFILYVGIVGVFGTIFVPIQGFKKTSILLLFLGCALIGLGEWKRERYHHQIKPANIHTGSAALISQKFQSNDKLGIVLEIIGFLLIIYTLYLLML